jgi:hypothetical protein
MKYMHIVDFVSGAMLQDQAELRASAGNDDRAVIRLRQLAEERLSYARRAMPLHSETVTRADAIKIYREEKKKDAICGVV